MCDVATGHRSPETSPARWLVTTSRLTVLGVTAVVATAALFSAHPGLSHAIAGGGFSPGAAAAGVVLVISLILGLPHGAVDLARLDGGRRRRALAAGLYVSAAGVGAGCWVLDPLLTLLALLALSAAHFGAADIALHTAPDDVSSGRSWRIGTALATGGLPVLVPLGLHGTAVLVQLDGLTAGHGDIVVTTCRTALPALAAVVILVAVRAARHHRWGVVGDLATLTTLFVLTSPLLAFATYFGLWHAWRQTGQMVAADAHALGLRHRDAAVRLLRQAALPSLLTLTAVAVLAAVGGHTVLVWSLAGVLCLTVPHAAMPALARLSGASGPKESRRSSRSAAGL